MTRRRKASATDSVATVAVSLARFMALAWLAPALLVNLDWSTDASIAWNFAAAGSILGSAVFVEAAIRAGSLGRSMLFAVVATLLIATNLQTAFENATHRSAARSDHRGSEIQAAQRASSQRLQWSQERDAAVEVAGLTPTMAIRANIDRAITQDAARWRSTNSCDPGSTTAQLSIAFCARVAGLRGQLAAAEQRDQLNTRIRELDISAASAPVPTDRDPFVEQAVAVLSFFGVALPDAAKATLGAIRDLVRSLSLELMAALGPSAWLQLMPRQSKSKALQASRRAFGQLPQTEMKTVTTDLSSESRFNTGPFNRFARDQLEANEGAMLTAGAAWMAWQAWCAKEDVDPGSQKKFGSSMKRRFKHQRNNNRPRYVDVVLRSKAGPPLKIAQQSSVRHLRATKDRIDRDSQFGKVADNIP